MGLLGWVVSDILKIVHYIVHSFQISEWSPPISHISLAGNFQGVKKIHSFPRIKKSFVAGQDSLHLQDLWDQELPYDL